MKRLFSRRLLSIPVVLIITILMAVNVMAETYTATTMRLLRYEGKVEIQDSSGKSSLVMENIRLNSGDSLQTGAGSSASVGLDSAKIVTLDENTKVEFTKQAKAMKLSLAEGSFLLDVSEKLSGDESLDIRTSTMAVGIRGTVVLVSTLPVGEYQSMLSAKKSDTSMSDLEEKIMQSSDGGGIVSVLGVLEGKVELVYQDEAGKSNKLEVSGGQKATLLDANVNDMVDIKPEVDKVTYSDIFSAADREIQSNPDLQKRLTDAGFDISDNSKVDSNYPAKGDWTISSPVTVIAQSASKMFDGQPLTRTSDILVQGLPSGLTFRASAGGSQTDAGSGDNPVSRFVIYNQKGEDVTEHFTNIQKVPGKLTVDPAPLTAWTADVTKVYDGKPLTSPETKLTFSPGYERNHARKNLSYVIAENGYITGSRSANNKSNKISRTASVSKSAAYIKPAVYGSSAAGYRPATYNTPVTLSSSVAAGNSVTGFKYVMSSGSAAGSEQGTGNKSVDGSGASSSAGQTSDLYDTQTLYGICGVVLVHGSNPLTEEIREINLSAGEKLTVHLSDENNEASIEYVIEKITEDEIPDEILRIYADNPDVLAQACTETGWSVEKVTERIKKLPPLEYKSSEVNGVKVDSQNAEDLMEDCTNVRITIDTEGTDYNDRALNEEEAHYMPMKADPSIRIVLNSSLTDVGTAQSTFSIDWGNANQSNYNLTMQPGTLTITPASATVTTGSAEKEYDGTPLTSSEASISGLVNNETATVVTTGSITDVGTADNTYTINWGTAKADNYTLTANVGTLKITGSKTGITFKAPSDSKTYDGTPLEAGAVTVTGLPEGFTFAATASGSQTDAGSSETTVNSYKILDRDGKDVTASFSNINTENGTLTVNPAAVTVTTGSASKEYDGVPLTSEEASISGLADADKDAVTVTATGSVTEVGTAENDYTISWGEAKSSNYTISENIGTLEVTKNNKEITFTSASAEKVYDGTPLTATTVTVEGLPEGLTYTASAGHTHAVTDAGTFKNYFDDMEYTFEDEDGNLLSGWRYAVIKDADGKDVTDNFTNIKLVEGTLTINPLDVIFELNSYDAVFSGQKVLPDGITGTYGDGSEVDEVSTTFEEDVFHLPIHLTSVFNLTGGGKVQIDCDGYSDAGNYEYAPEETFMDGNKNNYNISYTNTGVTIKPMDVRLTVSDGSCVYDGNYHAAELTDVSCGDNVTSIESIGDSEWRIFGYTVFINETINVKMEGGGGTDAGEYPLTYSYSFGNNDPDNYNIIEPTVNKTVIDPLMLLIDLGSPRVTYDGRAHGGNPSLKYENGPNSGETIEPFLSENYSEYSKISFKVPFNATIDVATQYKGPNAGTYTLRFNFKITDGKLDNYEFNFTGNKLIIDPRTITVKTGSATEAYDASNPNKPVTNSEAAIYNLVGSDQDLVTITATGSQIEVGSSENTYSINWNGVNSNNYDIIEHLGTLTKTRPTMGSLGFKERLKNKIKDSFEKATESSGDKQAGADSSVVNDPKAGDDSKPAANQSGDNTGSNTTGDPKTDKNDKTSTGTGKTADSTGESKKDEASSDAGKDESGKTESEKAEVTESEKSEEAEPEKTESSESGKSETSEVNKPEEGKTEEQEPEAQKSEEQKPEEQRPEEQKPEAQRPEAQKPEEQKPEVQNSGE